MQEIDLNNTHLIDSDKEPHLERHEIAKLNNWHKREMHKIAYNNAKLKLKLEQKQLKRKYKMKKKWQTTKIFFVFIFLNLMLIEGFSIYLMKLYGDLSPLVTLIGCAVGDVIAFGIYCYKAYIETKSEKAEQLEREKLGLTHDEEFAKG